MSRESFEWDPDKDIQNQLKHGVSFEVAQLAFFDPLRIFYEDRNHSQTEQRYFVLVKSTMKL